MFKVAQYIIRLDDASEYSDISKWNKIEQILDKNKIKPIVAVIPKNEDAQLKYSNLNFDFWDLVKKWEDKGWTIGMHGYKHVFHKVKRRKLIFPYYNKSEFAELTLEKQRLKIKKSIDVFKHNNLEPKVWIAPAHCFDETTLKALKKETQIKIISDGISFFPYIHKGFYFIPQQLWKLKFKFFGIWTVCLHPDTMTENDIINLDRNLSKSVFKNKIIGIDNISLSTIKKSSSIFDKFFSFFFWIKHETKIYLNKI